MMLGSQFQPCDKCKDSSVKGHIVNGNAISPCSCFVEWKKNYLLHSKLYLANIPDTIMDYNINSYHGTNSIESLNKIKHYVKVYNEKGRDKHLYIYGPNSTQKTTICFFIARELILQGVNVLYIPTLDLLINKLCIFENMRNDEVNEFLYKVNNVDLLIIDECFSKQQSHNLSDFHLNSLRSFLKNRLEIDRKSTIFISNIDQNNIEQKGYSKTIQSLICRETKDNILLFNDCTEQAENFIIDSLWD